MNRCAKVNHKEANGRSRWVTGLLSVHCDFYGRRAHWVSFQTATSLLSWTFHLYLGLFSRLRLTVTWKCSRNSSLWILFLTSIFDFCRGYSVIHFRNYTLLALFFMQISLLELRNSTLTVRMSWWIVRALFPFDFIGFHVLVPSTSRLTLAKWLLV